MPTIIDFSFARPTPAEIKAARVAGVLRYITEVSSKCLTGPEAASYHAAGIPIGLVYEDAADDFAGGVNAGNAKAHIAAPILKTLGVPAHRPVHCAVDCNLPQAAYPQTYAGIHAFCSTLGRPDAVYGPRPFLLWCEKTHGVEWLWELGSSSFNTGPEPTNKRLQQLVSKPSGVGTIGGVDYNAALCSDWGQWPAPLPAADQYALDHAMVQIDHAEALLAVAAHLAWYRWVDGKMIGHSDRNIPTGVTLYAFKDGLDAHKIPHAGA